MAITSVAPTTQHASNENVKTFSGFWGRFGRKRNDAPPAAQSKHSTFPNPDADTRILPQVGAPARQSQPAHAAPQVLYRERPADLDRAAYHIALAATNAGLNRSSAIKLEEDLAKHLQVVHFFANRERAEAQKLLARHDNGANASAAAADGIRRVVQAEQQANELPGVQVKAEIDTDALGRDLGATWANAHAVTEQTATFQPITPGMADPRVKVTVNQVEVTSAPAASSPSPVRAPGDGSTPPVPAAGDAEPVEEKLPHRTGRDAYGESSQVVGHVAALAEPEQPEGGASE